MAYEDMSDEALKEYALDLHDGIYGVQQCYSASDIVHLDSALDELYRRGYQSEEQTVLHIWRHDDWDEDMEDGEE
jgi:hypothetical protein